MSFQRKFERRAAREDELLHAPHEGRARKRANMALARTVPRYTWMPKWWHERRTNPKRAASKLRAMGAVVQKRSAA